MDIKKQIYIQVIKILSGPIAAALIMLCPAPETLGQQGLKGLAVVCWIILWWLTEAFPLPLTSLLSIPLSIMAGVLPMPKAIGFLGSPTMLIMIGAMLLLGAMKESHLIERYIYSVVCSSWVRDRPGRLLIVFGFSVGVLSAIMPNIPVSILFSSIAVTLALAMDAPKGAPLPRALIVCSGAGANLGGVGTPVGGVPNLLVMGIIASRLNHDIQFWEWAALGFPVTILWVAAMIIICWWLYLRKGCGSDSCLVMNPIRNRLTSLGPMSRREKISLGVLVMALIFWSFGNLICRLAGLADLAKMLNTPFISIMAGCVLFLLPISAKNGKINFVINWKDGLKSINWDIIIFIAGALLLGDVMASSQIDKWIGQMIGLVLSGMSPAFVWLALIALCALLAQIVNPVALITLLVPMSAAVGAESGLNPILVAATVGMTTNVSIMFPFSSPPMAAALLGSDGYAQASDFLKVAVPLIIACVLIAWFAGNWLGPLIFGG